MDTLMDTTTNNQNLEEATAALYERHHSGVFLVVGILGVGIVCGSLILAKKRRRKA